MGEFAFSRIAVVNRGESAARLFRAVSELNWERGADLTSIALHTEAEREASWVRRADEANQLTAPADGSSPYLNYDTLARAIKEANADAVWVGWGFVAEHADFADLCADLGVTFIGPPGDVIRRLGDKIEAKLLAESVGVPVAAWSGGPVETVAEAKRHGAEIGYPLLVKAAAGGGGRGIRRVMAEAELAEAFERARQEGAKAFGDPTVFMEKMVTGARHVEVQVAADHHGGAWALGVRDCSVQRRDQKIIEESSSPVLTDEHNTMLRTVAADLAVAAGYRNVGTVEFLYSPSEDRFAFLEVNTRLQVEHPITELTTGLDLVKLQLELASEHRLAGDPPPVNGHAIEVRLNAEDPAAGFAPVTGEITALRFPNGPGLRIDSGVTVGDRIQPEYDAMVAKVMAWGRDRAEARARLINGLSETVVATEGGTANTSFLLDLLDRPEVVDGSADTRWVDRLVEDGGHLPTEHAAVAVLVATAHAYLASAVYNRVSFFAAAAKGRPRLTHDPVTVVDCRLAGQPYRLQVQRIQPTAYRFEVDGQVLTMSIEMVDDVESKVTIAGRSHRVRSFTRGRDHLIEVDGVAHTVGMDDAGTVRAPSPSLVISVLAKPGDHVDQGDALVVLEAMKMETVVAAPFAGTVTEVLSAPSVQVDAGAALVTIEPDEEAGESEVAGTRIDFGPLVADLARAESGRDRFLRHLQAVRWTVLGYDTASGVVSRQVARLTSLGEEIDPLDPAVLEARLAIISAFGDITALARNRRVDDPGDEETHNPTEYFHRYLRSLDVEAEGLPAGFRMRLKRAFAHYGAGDLEPGLALERAAFRIFHAQAAAATQEPLVAAVLEGLRVDVTALEPETAERLRETLSGFVTSTELRFPNLGSLARSIEYEVFDAPMVTAAQDRLLADMRLRLRRLRDGAGSPADATVLLECPEVIGRLLALPWTSPNPDPLLSIMFRRLYRAVDLDQITEVGAGSDGDRATDVCAGRYHDPTSGPVCAVATMAPIAEVGPAVSAALDRAATLADGARVSLDCYLTWNGAEPADRPIGGTDRVEEQLDQTMATIAPIAGLDRVTLTWADAEENVAHHTYRPRLETGDGAGSLVQDLSVRNVHPMIAARLGLDRLANFELRRLDSPAAVHAYRAVGVDNPKDVRLVAAAEVRDLTPRVDRSGEVEGFPAAERAMAACADAIRQAQNVHDPDRRLLRNRIMLYVWPPFDHPLSTLQAMADRLAAPIADLGLDGVELRGRLVADGHEQAVTARLGFEADEGRLIVTEPDDQPIPVLDRYEANVVASRRRGAVYPYELIERLTRDGSTFVEHDVLEGVPDQSPDAGETDDGTSVLVPVDRPPGSNGAGFVAGVVTSPSDRYPSGISRVVLMGDPTKGLASIAEAECRLVIAACTLAEHLGVPIDWYALSAGARIAMDSGTENMDWISRALRRIIEFTQAGGEINVVVAGINVGAQPYWNAEATMLMHTKGILVMTPDSAMVLTGKQSLDYSGGVSAEDNFGIGGYDRIMGPNGQAQYWAADIDGAIEIVRRHHEQAWVAPGDRFPRPFPTVDPAERDVSSAPHEGPEFDTVGQVFSEDANPGRKMPFDMASIMRAVSDTDHQPLERWGDMRDAETAIVHESRLDGHPVMMVGISSRALARTGFIPADGPSTWTAGTLFPLSSKKIARAINAASGSRPLVVLANLSGFDGSPESLAQHQLEFGAEIGRAITNFDGPIVFCLVSRYHGGAFVVFSKVLNDNMEVLAVEGSFASVLGGAPAAAVVFAREVDARTDADPRLVELAARIEAADEGERVGLRAEFDELRAAVRAEKLGEKANEFDAVHTIQRAVEVGSVDRIITAGRLRPELIAALKRGRARAHSRT